MILECDLIWMQEAGSRTDAQEGHSCIGEARLPASRASSLPTLFLKYEDTVELLSHSRGNNRKWKRRKKYI